MWAHVGNTVRIMPGVARSGRPSKAERNVHFIPVSGKASGAVETETCLDVIKKKKIP